MKDLNFSIWTKEPERLVLDNGLVYYIIIKDGEFKLHRVDGPAIENPDGTFCWFLEDIEYTKIEWLNKLGKLQ